VNQAHVLEILQSWLGDKRHWRGIVWFKIAVVVVIVRSVDYNPVRLSPFRSLTGRL
jgi:hypothetical protein